MAASSVSSDPPTGTAQKSGGALITSGSPRWESLDGHREVAAAWLLNEDKVAGSPDTHLFRIGRGMVYVITANGIPDYVGKVTSVLTLTAKAQPANAPLNGFNAKADQKQVTDFPSGRLVFDPKTLSTEFISKGGLYISPL